MSASEIIAELPRLNAAERQQVFERLCELQENDLINGAGPTDEEKRILDEAMAEMERDGDPRRPWREVLAEIRASGDVGRALPAELCPGLIVNRRTHQ